MGNPYLDEITALRRRVEELEHEIAEIRANIDRGTAALVARFGLTHSQAKMIAAMSSGEIMTREHLERICGRDDLGDPRNIDSQVKRIRNRKIAGLAILSHYGIGYSLSHDAARMVQSAMRA